MIYHTAEIFVCELTTMEGEPCSRPCLRAPLESYTRGFRITNRLQQDFLLPHGLTELPICLKAAHSRAKNVRIRTIGIPEI